MTKGRQSTQVRTRPRASRYNLVSQCLTTFHTWWSRFQTIEGNMFQRWHTWGPISESPHLIFIASCIPKILLLNTFHLPKYLQLVRWCRGQCQSLPIWHLTTHVWHYTFWPNKCWQKHMRKDWWGGSDAQFFPWESSKQPAIFYQKFLTFRLREQRQGFFGRVFNNWQRAFVTYDIYDEWITGLPNSPKTKMINGIMLVVLPQTFLQVSLWRCNLKGIDWLVVPGAWVPNPPKCRRPDANGILRVRIWTA